MPRRYYTYPADWQVWNVLSSAGASILAVAYTLPLLYLGWSLIWGRKATSNPWRATGLEWQTTSPPPTENFPRTPIVTVGPYQYNSADGSYIAQDGSSNA
jgi:cytochrome c oxidase subunit 1